MITGIDISHWQSSVDWSEWAAKGYKFVWMKATEGTGFTDSGYITHYENAGTAGFLRAPYHFYRNWPNPEDQAAYFRAVVGDRVGEMPPTLDIEDTSAPKLGATPDRALRCLKEIEILFGKRPVIYSAKWWWNPWMWNQGWANDYDLWAANYTTASSPVLPAGWNGWTIWQHTSKPIDQNRMQNWYWDTLTSPPEPPSDAEERVEELELQVGRIKKWGESFPV